MITSSILLCPTLIDAEDIELNKENNKLINQGKTNPWTNPLNPLNFEVKYLTNPYILKKFESKSLLSKKLI